MKAARTVLMSIPLFVSFFASSCSKEEDESPAANDSAQADQPPPATGQPSGDSDPAGIDSDYSYSISMQFVTIYNFTGSIAVSLNNSETITIVATEEPSYPKFVKQLADGESYSVVITQNLLSDRAHCTFDETNSRDPASGKISGNDINITYVCNDELGPEQPTTASFSNTDAGTFDLTMALTDNMWNDTRSAWIIADTTTRNCNDENLTTYNTAAYSQEDLDPNGNASITLRGRGIPGITNTVTMCSYDANNNVSQVMLGTVDIPAWTIFLSRNATTGNTGGTAGADALCQGWAEDAELTGKWRAIISAEINGSPYSMQSGYEETFLNTAGDTLITEGNLFTIDSSLDFDIPITTDENGDPVGVVNVFTGVKNNGTYTATHCNNWTSDSNAQTGGGTISGFSTGWNANQHTISCSTSAHLFCVNGQSSRPE